MLIGVLTGSVVGFGVCQTICWQCNAYKRKGLALKDYPSHPCKRSHVGSSASMETALAVKMQAELAGKGARLSVVVGDCDTHAISHLNAAEMPELRNVQKCHDLNHLSKNLKKSLASLKDKFWKGNTKVLTSIIAGHLAHTFSRVVYRYRFDPTNQVLPLDAVDLLSDVVPLEESIPIAASNKGASSIPNPADDVAQLIGNHLDDDALLPEDFGNDFSVFDFPNTNVDAVSENNPNHKSDKDLDQFIGSFYYILFMHLIIFLQTFSIVIYSKVFRILTLRSTSVTPVKNSGKFFCILPTLRRRCWEALLKKPFLILLTRVR